MKIFIFSMLFVLSFSSVANSNSGFVLQKNRINDSIVSSNIINSAQYSSVYGCYDECDEEFEIAYDFYCSGGYYDTQVCEILEDELQACYDECNY